MGFFEWLGSSAASAAGIQAGTPLYAAAEFFVADTVKVFALLSAMVFLVAIARTHVTPQKVRQLLGGRKEGAGNVLAALLGIPTPFCSCSAVPLFIGFVESGIPLGVTFSFLIASPLINEVAIALLWGMFGWKIAALYIGTGLAIAILAGFAIGRLKLDGDVESFVWKAKAKKPRAERLAWNQRIGFAKEEVLRITGRVAPFIVIGIAIGALMHGYAPVDFLSGIAGRENLLAVPLAVLIGVPLYSNAAGMIPIVEALVGKGMALGTALAFMMSVTALSLPEMIILRRVLKPRLIAIFAAILALSFVLVGWLFNAIIA